MAVNLHVRFVTKIETRARVLGLIPEVGKLNTWSESVTMLCYK